MTEVEENKSFSFQRFKKVVISTYVISIGVYAVLFLIESIWNVGLVLIPFFIEFVFPFVIIWGFRDLDAVWSKKEIDYTILNLGALQFILSLIGYLFTAFSNDWSGPDDAEARLLVIHVGAAFFIIHLIVVLIFYYFNMKKLSE